MSGGRADVVSTPGVAVCAVSAGGSDAASWAARRVRLDDRGGIAGRVKVGGV